MIKVYNLSVAFLGEKKALDNVSFKIPKGEFVYITGESGAGKTTLLRLFYVDILPSRGIVLISNKDISNITKKSTPFLRRNIGVIFQDFKLLENKTVYENVKLALEVFYLEKNNMENRILPLLRRLGIYSRRSTLVRKLSGGEKQRVAIARALINNPAIILADEPTGNLDQAKAEDIIDLLYDTAKSGTTVIVATHDPNVLNRYKDARVLELKNGKIIKDTHNI